MSQLLYDVSNQVATITLNRPEWRNALSGEMIDLFFEHLDSAANDKDVRVLIITGAGEKAYCAGADLGGGVGKSGTTGYADLLKRIINFPKPTLSMVRGYCLAGGMGLMLASDIVVASETAVFGTPEVNVGLWPSMISALIYRNMLPKHALPMILLGERYGAEQAREMGFVTAVHPDGELDTAVEEIAHKLTRKSPIGMRLGKASYTAMQDMPLEEALDFLNQELAKVANTKDAAEGIAAFMEKREARFTGE